MDFEQTARNYHRSRMNCAASVYKTFEGVNRAHTEPPRPRGEGGKCGAVLAAEKVLREMGDTDPESFDREFLALYGSLYCADLRGRLSGRCNDFVGTAASLVEKRLKEKEG